MVVDEQPIQQRVDQVILVIDLIPPPLRTRHSISPRVPARLNAQTATETHLLDIHRSLSRWASVHLHVPYPNLIHSTVSTRSGFTIAQRAPNNESERNQSSNGHEEETEPERRGE